MKFEDLAGLNDEELKRMELITLVRKLDAEAEESRTRAELAKREREERLEKEKQEREERLEKEKQERERFNEELQRRKERHEREMEQIRAAIDKMITERKKTGLEWLLYPFVVLSMGMGSFLAVLTYLKGL